MSYHLKEIPKGQLGSFSKIREEFLEAEDAYEQKSVVMVMCELADLLGAIEMFTINYNIGLNDLVKMKDITKRAFESGRRS